MGFGLLVWFWSWNLFLALDSDVMNFLGGA